MQSYCSCLIVEELRLTLEELPRLNKGLVSNPESRMLSDVDIETVKCTCSIEGSVIRAQNQKQTSFMYDSYGKMYILRSPPLCSCYGGAIVLAICVYFSNPLQVNDTTCILPWQRSQNIHTSDMKDQKMKSKSPLQVLLGLLMLLGYVNLWSLAMTFWS